MVDPLFPFVTVVFTNTNSSFDGFGFDDMTIGSTGPCSLVPGPADELLVETANGGAELHLKWTDASDADDHVLFMDQSPAGSFDVVAGTAPAGIIGLTVPMPEGNRFYLVAGSNSTCGVGPKR